MLIKSISCGIDLKAEMEMTEFTADMDLIESLPDRVYDFQLQCYNSKFCITIIYST